MQNFMLRKGVEGLWPGIMATSAMTFFLFAAHRQLIARRPLPPAALTHELQTVAGVNEGASSAGREHKAMLAHFAFGTMAGLAYAFLPRQLKASPLLAGSSYGLAIWGTSYLGWIPALGLSPAANRAPKEENFMMLAGHLVYGAALGYSEKELAERGRKLLDGKQAA